LPGELELEPIDRGRRAIVADGAVTKSAGIDADDKPVSGHHSAEEGYRGPGHIFGPRNTLPSHAECDVHADGAAAAIFIADTSVSAAIVVVLIMVGFP
jgi:hypothetical protein